VQPTRCREDTPPLRPIAPGHTVACHWAEDIRSGKITPHERPPVFEEQPPAELVDFDPSAPSYEPPPV
jgi:peptide/nickel transport system ATP-binding protein